MWGIIINITAPQFPRTLNVKQNETKCHCSDAVEEWKEHKDRVGHHQHQKTLSVAPQLVPRTLSAKQSETNCHCSDVG